MYSEAPSISINYVAYKHGCPNISLDSTNLLIIIFLDNFPIFYWLYGDHPGVLQKYGMYKDIPIFCDDL
jgi:hypothetical protein